MNQDDYDRLTILLADATKALTEAEALATGNGFGVWGPIEWARMNAVLATERLEKVGASLALKP